MTLFDEVVDLGYDRSCPTFIRQIAPVCPGSPACPTIRHASELLVPQAIRRVNFARCAVNGAGPCLSFGSHHDLQRPGVLRRSLEVKHLPAVGVRPN